MKPMMLIAVLAALALAGCNRDDSKSTPKTSATPPASTAPAPSSPAPSTSPMAPSDASKDAAKK